MIVTLWEEKVDVLVVSKSYKLTQFMVRDFDMTNSLSLCRQGSSIEEVDDIGTVQENTEGRELRTLDSICQQTGGGIDIQAAPHWNQIYRHLSTDDIVLGIAHYQHPHTHHPQVAWLPPAANTAVRGEGTTAEGDNVTVLVQLP